MQNINVSLEGEYTLERRKADGTLVETIGPFKNLITDEGLNGLGVLTGSKSARLDFCFVGSSNATPVNTNIALGNQIACIGAGTVNIAARDIVGDEMAVSLRWNYSFPAGQAAGNLAEIGIGSSALNGGAGRPGGAPNYLFSRALIVDGSGNPTTITLLSDEILNVTYTLKFYIPTTVMTSTIVDSTTGITHTLQRRLVDSNNMVVNTFGSLRPTVRALGNLFRRTVAGTPITFSANTTGIFLGATALSDPQGSITDVAYVNNSNVAKVSGTVALGEGNSATGIEAWATYVQAGFGGLFSFRTGMLISPPIMKDATKVLNITFSISWARRP